MQRADYGDDDDTPLYLSASNADPDHRHVEAASIAPDEGESMVETLIGRLATESELDEGEMHTAAYIIRQPRQQRLHDAAADRHSHRHSHGRGGRARRGKRCCAFSRPSAALNRPA